MAVHGSGEGQTFDMPPGRVRTRFTIDIENWVAGHRVQCILVGPSEAQFFTDAAGSTHADGRQRLTFEWPASTDDRSLPADAEMQLQFLINPPSEPGIVDSLFISGRTRAS
jgi:hypothetical protein